MGLTLLRSVALASLVTVGCGPEAPMLFPDGASGSPSDLRGSASPLARVVSEGGDGEQSVTVSGTIGKVCRSMGCWFYVTDGEQMVLVDLKAGGFTIPIDSSGRPCVVEGRLHTEGSDRRIDARRVALWPQPQ